jgi:hypothetical protein
LVCQSKLTGRPLHRSAPDGRVPDAIMLDPKAESLLPQAVGSSRDRPFCGDGSIAQVPKSGRMKIRNRHERTFTAPPEQIAELLSERDGCPPHHRRLGERQLRGDLA